MRKGDDVEEVGGLGMSWCCTTPPTTGFSLFSRHLALDEVPLLPNPDK